MAGSLKKTVLISALFCLLLSFAGCGAGAADTESGGNGGPEPSAQQSREREASVENGQTSNQAYTEDTAISQVIGDPDLGSFGRLAERGRGILGKTDQLSRRKKA